MRTSQQIALALPHNEDGHPKMLYRVGLVGDVPGGISSTGCFRIGASDGVSSTSNLVRRRSDVSSHFLRDHDGEWRLRQRPGQH